VVNALAADRRVIAFDYAGAGGSTGQPADTIEQMARATLSFSPDARGPTRDDGTVIWDVAG
jgi:pimeloyl-ACP methyl ester carboxylesterase